MGVLYPNRSPGARCDLEECGSTVLTICGSIAGAVILAASNINPFSQMWIRVLAAIAFPVIMLCAYLIGHAIRAPWKLHQEHAKAASDTVEKSAAVHAGQLQTLSQNHAVEIRGYKDAARAIINEHAQVKRALEEKIEGLAARLSEAESRLKRPTVFIQFIDVDTYKVPFEDRTEFVVKNTSDHDVYGLTINIKLDESFVLTSVSPLNLPRGETKRITYWLGENGSGNLEFRGNLRELLDRLAGNIDEVFEAAVNVRYKDYDGRWYQPPFRLYHCLGALGTPFIEPVKPPESGTPATE